MFFKIIIRSSKKFSDFIYPFLKHIVMLLIENQAYGESFNPIGNTLNYFIEIFLKAFNKICYDIFQYGNIFMFLIFLFMSLNLLLSAREKEYQEKINARNLEFLKKRGRIGTVICFFLGIGYLVKVIPILILLCLKPFPAPLIFNWLNISDYYDNETTLKDIYSYNVYETGLLFFICILSFCSTIMLTVALYLIFFNQRILYSKLKAAKLLVTGIALGFVFGLAPGFWLLI